MLKVILFAVALSTVLIAVQAQGGFSFASILNQVEDFSFKWLSNVEIKLGLPENGNTFGTFQNKRILRCPENYSIFWQALLNFDIVIATPGNYILDIFKFNWNKMRLAHDVIANSSKKIEFAVKFTKIFTDNDSALILPDIDFR